MATVVGSLAIDEPTTIDKRADTTTHTTGEGTVEREIVNIGSPDNTRTANRAEVLTADPVSGDPGLIVRNIPSGTQVVSGTVTADQGAAAAASGAWPVKSTDASGVNQQAITAAGDAKVTLDGEVIALPTGAATEATLAGDISLDQSHTRNEGFKESAAVGAEMDETAPVAATEGNVSPCRMDANRSLYVQLRSGGAEVGTAGSPVRVDPTGGTTQPISAASLPLPAGAATSANQLADGHNVTVDNLVGSAVFCRITDGVETASVTAANRLAVDVEASVLPTGAATSASQLADGHNVTVDNAVGNPAFVRQSDGAAAIDPRDSRDTIKTLKTASINVAGSGDNTIIALVAGRRLKVHMVVLNSTGTVNAKWKDGAAADLTGDMNFQAREGYTVAVTPPGWILATSAGNALILNLSAAIAVDGWVAYWDDDTT